MEQEISAHAERFWRDAGKVELFPRTLESAVSWALPLVLVKLPRLGVDELRAWLDQRGVRLPCAIADRPLRGALLARGGHGFVFLDGSDPDDERRFTLAHEVAHFLSDYLAPRDRALQAFGESIRDVLDGRRRPAPEERLSALLRDVALGLYTHWMDRRPDGAIGWAQILEAEHRADRLALELLAPRRVVTARLQGLGADPAVDVVTGILCGEFGLPFAPANAYAAMLCTQLRASRSFRDWMGISSCRTSPSGSE